jgi:serralysin
MFFGLNSIRSSAASNIFLEEFEGFTGRTERFIGVGEAVEPVENASFGAIASYQVCACCARFHGPTTEADGGGGPVFGLNADDRGVFGPNGKPSLSSTDAGAQITRTNQSWASGLGTAATVTYAFRDSVTTMPTDTAGFSQFNATQIAASVLAFAAWSDVANITFQRVQNVGSEFSNDATILLGNYSSGQDGAAAFAYLPGGMPGSTGFSQVQGDVWINSSLSYNALPVQQGYGQLTLLHEIGHAIGLSHPAAYNASAGGSITYSASAIYYEDSLQYSVMSYFSERETGADFRTDGAGTRRYSSAPLLDDISAAQRLYGSNMSTRTGDTVYGFNSNAGRLWYGATNELSPLVFCAWDAGGTDTFDFSGYLNNGQIIDLRQGCFSSVGGLVGNVSIALGAVIENAIGGSGSDTFRGNSANNRFTPNTGTDVVDGGLGTDTVVFSGARAAYAITWNGQTGTVVGNGQNVTVTNVEFLQFTDQTIAATPTGGVVVGGDITDETITGTALADVIGGLGGNDVINGLAGSDNLNGGSGNDTLNGGDDNDILIGALGNDTLNGGAGVDTADYSGAGAGVTVNLTSGAASGGGGTDTLSQVENVTGTAFTDTLTGDGAANVLRGGGGVDTLSGGGGADELYAGAPGLAGGAPDIIKGSDTTNGSIGTAVSLSGAFDLADNASIANSTTIPHATVVATTHGNVEYYRVTVIAGETVNFDIDGASFDSTLRLFDGAGVELASNDDSAADGGASTDSALSHTFATAGTYYIQVGRWVSGSAPFVSGPPPANQTYTLHVSSPSQPTTPIVLLGSTLNGDAGADILTGGTGADTLNGGSEDDTLTGTGGNDTINGGDGTDTAVFTGNRSAYTITVSGGVSTVVGPDGTDTVSNVERLQFADGLFDAAGAPISTGGPINGTSGADTLNGTSGADVINGLGGNDNLSGLAGNDTLDGGDGDDILNGGAGSDTISGGAGSDTVSFAGSATGAEVYLDSQTTWDGTSNDFLNSIENATGSDHSDYMVGTSAANVLTGGAGNDFLYGMSGDDLLTGGTGVDRLVGGDGVDTITYAGSAAGVEVNLGNGVSWDGTSMDFIETVENVTGSDHSDYFVGTAVANTLIGGAGNDFLFGMGGDDLLIGGTGVDRLVGGDGVDTITYAGAAAGVEVYLDNGISWDGTSVDFIETVENVTGSDHADYFVGTAVTNMLIGGAGNDFLFGMGGDDLLIGGTGVDRLVGGDGVDTITYAGSAAGVEVYLDDGISWDGTSVDFIETVENVTGSDHADYVVGTTGANILIGGAGNDFLSGLAGDDILNGGSGVDQLLGGDGVDTITYAGSATGVEIYLNSQVTWDGTSTDFLGSIENAIGSDHADYLSGSTGANVLTGGAGDDVLVGAAGNDTLEGGTGTDRAVYSGNRAAYTISVSGGVTTVTGPDGTDTLTDVERLQFADGLYDIGGNPVAAPAIPQVQPVLAGDKFVVGPEVLPTAPGDFTKEGGAEVLPAMSDDRVKFEAPQVLPGEATDVTTPGREQLGSVDFATRDGDTAETLFLFDGSANDGYLFVARNNGGYPEVLPAMDDGFVLTGKFDDAPPVLPTINEFDGAPVSLTEMEQARELMMALIRENPFNSFGDSLTLLDDWSGVAAPSRDDVFG